jgi:zinc protease
MLQLFGALKNIFVGVVLILFSSPGWAVTPPPGVTALQSVEGITEYRLEANGLRILLAPDDSKPSTTVNMT